MAAGRLLNLPGPPQASPLPGEFNTFLRMDPDDDDDYDASAVMNEIYEELADYNDSAARCHDEGWFYADDD